MEGTLFEQEICQNNPDFGLRMVFCFKLRTIKYYHADFLWLILSNIDFIDFLRFPYMEGTPYEQEIYQNDLIFPAQNGILFRNKIDQMLPR